MALTMNILGLCTSCRSRLDSQKIPLLLEDLKSIKDENQLKKYLCDISCTKESESSLSLLTYFRNCRQKNIPANSDLSLAAGLWGALQKKNNINALSLIEYFGETGFPFHGAELSKKLKDADAILLSGPVYFGDRCSLTQDFMTFLSSTPELLKSIAGKLYAGIASGAKRNGGQETTLIYQILDMTALGFLGVGNDSSTTSQYGGTVHAGEAGTAHLDSFGIKTSVGTGARLGALLQALSHGSQLRRKPSALFIILQDADSNALRATRRLTEKLDNDLKSMVIDLTPHHLLRCKSCSICPTKFTSDEQYSCVNRNRDIFSIIHAHLLDNEMIVPVIYSREKRYGLTSNYQRFMERTRYLRRSDYALSNTLVVPFVLSSLGIFENYHIRMVTSFIRHHTVISSPLIGYMHKSDLINEAAIVKGFRKAAIQAGRIGASRIIAGAGKNGLTLYNPVGYVLKNKNDNNEHERRRALYLRQKRMKQLATQMLEDFDE